MLDKLFDYLDTIFAKLTRVWMYSLEIAGMSFIFIRMRLHDAASSLIVQAKTPLEVQRAKEYYDSVTKTTESIAPIVILLCVIMPAVIATLRTVRKKWSLKTPLGEINQEFCESGTKENTT